MSVETIDIQSESINVTAMSMETIDIQSESINVTAMSHHSYIVRRFMVAGVL